MQWTPKSIPRKTYLAYRRAQVLDNYNIPTVIQIDFNVENASTPQPVTMEDNIPLPEGLSDSELYKIFTTTPLRGTEEGTNNQADIIIINGIRYVVVRCKDWMAIQQHYEVYVAKEPNQ